MLFGMKILTTVKVIPVQSQYTTIINSHVSTRGSVGLIARIRDFSVALNFITIMMRMSKILTTLLIEIQI